MSSPPPKRPFRTKNSTAAESVVIFCYRRSFFTICTVVLLPFPRKTSISEHSPYYFATAVVNLVPVLNFLSVVFSVRKGPLGNLQQVVCNNCPYLSFKDALYESPDHVLLFLVLKDAAFLLAIGSFLLTVELFYLPLTILAFCLHF